MHGCKIYFTSPEGKMKMKVELSLPIVRSRAEQGRVEGVG